MGAMVQQAVTPIDGYMKGFVINGFILIVSGLLGLLLLWPDTELARLRLISQPDAVRDRTKVRLVQYGGGLRSSSVDEPPLIKERFAREGRGKTRSGPPSPLGLWRGSLRLLRYESRSWLAEP